ncbi:MAG: VWA domain-containing protein [Polyangia bacterium]
MTLFHVTFVHPLWLLAGLAGAAVILLLGVRLDRQRRVALRLFSSRTLASSLSPARRIAKRGLLVLGMLAGATAMARPQHGFRWEEAQRRGVDLLFVVDTSKSMLATDLKPDRLTRAKLAVRDLVDKFGGDRVGLVAFSGDAFLQCPLTLDRDMFGQTLDALDTKIIARGGTDVGRAIEVATTALRNEPGNEKIIVLLTDGEDLEAHAVEAAAAARKAGMRIYTVGIGTPAGELVPLAEGAPGLVRDASGAFVRSRLDEKSLRAIAHAGDGEYRFIGADGLGLEALYRDVLAKLPKEALATKSQRVPLEVFQWPLGASALCLALEALLRDRRRPAPRAVVAPIVPARRARTRKMAAAAVIALVGGAAGTASAAPRDPRLQFNAATTAYKSGDFAGSEKGFQDALHAEALDLQQRTYYDLGNTQYRIGQKTEKTAPDKTIAQWKTAIASYESALHLDAHDGDAKFNRDLVKKRLAALEQQEKQKKDQQKKDDQKKDQKDQKSASNGGKQDKPDQGKQGKPDQKSASNGGKQDKPGDGEQDKQDQKSASNGGKQDKPGEGKQDKPDPGAGAQQQAQAKGAQPSKPGQPQPGQPQPGQDAQGEAVGAKDDQAAPGTMSKREARAVLDAMRGDERLLSAAPSGRPGAPKEDTVERDW